MGLFYDLGHSRGELGRLTTRATVCHGCSRQSLSALGFKRNEVIYAKDKVKRGEVHKT